MTLKALQPGVVSEHIQRRKHVGYVRRVGTRRRRPPVIRRRLRRGDTLSRPVHLCLSLWFFLRRAVRLPRALAVLDDRQPRIRRRRGVCKVAQGRYDITRSPVTSIRRSTPQSIAKITPPGVLRERISNHGSVEAAAAVET